jgi:predicted CoA-substrate-specific enzyme activase
MNKLGIDIGSTTVKLVLLDEKGTILFKRYDRHMSNIYEKVAELLLDLSKSFPDLKASVVITGSGGLAMSGLISVPFEQEVIAASMAVRTLIPDTDVAIELGGEDAKLTYYDSGGVEQRMNGTCAGGTGAFIDQMAILLSTDAAGLNEAAKDQKIIYPIAARCGVFAKTDIQPLINEGAHLPDLAASIFQAVVNQTISGLACGRAIRGKVAFLGGPLSFLSELKARFVETLGLKDGDIISPADSQFFVAIGAALMSADGEVFQISEVLRRLSETAVTVAHSTEHLLPLFKDKSEYSDFIVRHSESKVLRGAVEQASGGLFLGIDAGSTTTKAVLIDADKRLLYSFYESNQGRPIEVVRKMLRDMYAKLGSRLGQGACYIGRVCVTGYGEGLIMSAFSVDMGEIETMAHYRAAQCFLPDVDFILDIGGQDMKCMRIKNGTIYNIMLNEACSSGCGSFIETYAKSVDMGAPDFANEGLSSDQPVDLGTRCTVFMNSCVKQAQKEGATIADISAGLSYSVIKNALYKVIKLRNADEAGKNIVVQGGTFLNDAILRATENVLGREVVRPDIAGNMGAFGAAIIARDCWAEGETSTILKATELDSLSVMTSHTRCGLCENNCLLTINKFTNKESFITGNRCERGEGKSLKNEDIPNLYTYKYERLFAYEPLDKEKAKRGEIGIPRVLGLYENYPFWYRFFTSLGFSVKLSPTSTKTIYEQGMDTISSDTACYPAKLVHGHIKELVKSGVRTIWFPCINYEYKDNEIAKNADNHYNCPIVATYPEVIAKNMRELFSENSVNFLYPFIAYDRDDRLERSLYKVFSSYGITKKEIKTAIKQGREEYQSFKQDLLDKGRQSLALIKEKNIKGVVLAGRPYHIDPEINHGYDKLIASFGLAVFTEDSLDYSDSKLDKRRVLDQWTYHSRLYWAADYVGENKDLELIQLNSFGCGLDAITTDQVAEILESKNGLYTVLKIDEGANLGAARIRIRSLKAAIEERTKNKVLPKISKYNYERRIFTKKMRQDFTILIPQMSPIHFRFVEAAVKACGYNALLLPVVDAHAVEEGLRYVNNDACYPTIVTLGQIISFLKSGKVDINKTALFMSQTGGMCRASNYVSLLRHALEELGMPQIPVVSANMSGLEKNPGFKFTLPLIKKGVRALVFGDVLMRLVNATRPYEEIPNSVSNLQEKFSSTIENEIASMTTRRYKNLLSEIVKAFDELPLLDINKPKVGVVGEILVKYHPNANNDIVDIIEREGGEAVVLDLIDFFLYGMYSKEYNYKHLSGGFLAMLGNKIAIEIVESFRKPAVIALKNSKRFRPPERIEHVAEKASKLISLGNQCGEGWLLTGEMIELIDQGVPNIVCLQPFACLPNHVSGKGMIKALREYNKMANIAAIDYDPGASDTNQLNRIKLMMTTAHQNLRK